MHANAVRDMVWRAPSQTEQTMTKLLVRSLVAMGTIGFARAFFEPTDHPFVDLERSAAGCLNPGCDLCGAEGCKWRSRGRAERTDFLLSIELHN